ncbi:MAG: hypothetical protein ACAH59_08090, partial [Pseudobdellovibrionaceae bacterium]
FRGLKARFPIPILATVASLSFLYNESFSMWGGNSLSTLAGQFAHLYAFNFFLLAIGALQFELSRKRFPWISSFLLGAVLLSHFYVALYLPLVFLCFLFFEKTESFQARFKKLLLAGLSALGLAAWFVIPMLHNAKWNTAFGLKWSGAKLFQEAFPLIFWPFAFLAGLFCLLFLAFAFLKRDFIERETQLILPLLIFLILGSVIYYFIFPPLGLVDIRIFPALQMSLCFFAALAVGLFLNRMLPQTWVLFLTVFLVLIGLWWPFRQIHNFSPWMKWNYSGWQSKEAYSDLKNLSRDLQGSLSDPRVIYENSDLSNIAGSMRVFEMLPYFANRSTMESVYMQATILAPAAFYLQALISKTPSCPFPNYQCTGYNLSQLKFYMPLMGISQLILISPEVRNQAGRLDFLDFKDQYGIWYLYDSKIPTALVEVLREAPRFIPEKNFKSEFYNWFLAYTGQEPFLVVAPEKDQPRILQSVGHQECHANVTVDFRQIKLTTDCPGRFHILKFAFHSTWKASTGDSLYLMSPGFIGFIPSQSEVTLTWGRHWLWTLSDLFSWLVLLSLLVIWAKSWMRNRRERKA